MPSQADITDRQPTPSAVRSDLSKRDATARSIDGHMQPSVVPPAHHTRTQDFPSRDPSTGVPGRAPLDPLAPTAHQRGTFIGRANSPQQQSAYHSARTTASAHPPTSAPVRLPPVSTFYATAAASSQQSGISSYPGTNRPPAAVHPGQVQSGPLPPIREILNPNASSAQQIASAPQSYPSTAPFATSGSSSSLTAGHSRSFHQRASGPPQQIFSRPGIPHAHVANNTTTMHHPRNANHYRNG